MEYIKFTKPDIHADDHDALEEVIHSGHLCGDGAFTRKCHEYLNELYGSRTLLTHSCTAALEMAAMLLNLSKNDEVIMPSYTFVSTANPFVLRGAVPVFIDVKCDLNIDESLIESAITSKTKAICVVHYAGIACEMDAIMEIAKRHNLMVVEDAAQAFGSTYKGQPLGSIGHLAALSFHHTKNVVSGEGGALIVNDESLFARAEIIREKGTNRSSFQRGEVNLYTWEDIGSSYLISDILAALLYSQLKRSKEINDKRMVHWKAYYHSLEPVQDLGLVSLPKLHPDATHNAHMFYIIMRSEDQRDEFISYMRANHVNAVFHYIPLHSSPAGIKYTRTASTMNNTDALSARLVRLPLFGDLTTEEVNRVIMLINQFYKNDES